MNSLILAILVSATEVPEVEVLLLPLINRSQGEVHFFVDKALFRASDTLYRAEIYYFMDPSTLESPKESLAYRVSVRLEDQAGLKTPLLETWEKKIGRDRAFEVDQFALFVLPGKYTLEMTVENIEGKGKGTLTLPFEVQSGSDALELSEVQLGWAFSQDTFSVFSKYGVGVLPNPLASFGMLQDTLYFFLEIYHLAGDSENYTLNYGIHDSTGHLIQASKPQIKAKKGKKGVEFGAISIKNLNEGGTYTLLLEAVDLTTGARARREKRFYRTGTSMVLGEENPPDFIDYFASAEETQLLKTLEGPNKKLFLLRFWKRWDPSPGTAQNEFSQELVGRIEYADKNFGQQGDRGGRWSDRGRIYIKYGPPDEVRRESISFGERDREHWYYYRSRGMEFIFVDIRGTGTFELLYSSIPEEPTSTDWQRYIPEGDIEREDW